VLNKQAPPRPCSFYAGGASHRPTAPPACPNRCALAPFVWVVLHIAQQRHPHAPIRGGTLYLTQQLSPSLRACRWCFHCPRSLFFSCLTLPRSPLCPTARGVDSRVEWAHHLTCCAHQSPASLALLGVQVL